MKKLVLFSIGLLIITSNIQSLVEPAQLQQQYSQEQINACVQKFSPEIRGRFGLDTLTPASLQKRFQYLPLGMRLTFNLCLQNKLTRFNCKGYGCVVCGQRGRCRRFIYGWRRYRRH